MECVVWSGLCIKLPSPAFCLLHLLLFAFHSLTQPSLLLLHQLPHISTPFHSLLSMYFLRFKHTSNTLVCHCCFLNVPACITSALLTSPLVSSPLVSSLLSLSLLDRACYVRSDAETPITTRRNWETDAAMGLVPACDWRDCEREM